MAGEWVAPPKTLPSTENACHIWRVQLTGRDWLDCLSNEERGRASRFKFDEDRDRYIASHSSLRQILGRYLGLAPERLMFARGGYGKPWLEDHPEFKFNLSHAGNLALIAVTTGREVGVDVEVVSDSLDFMPLAKRFFSEAEFRELSLLAEEERRLGFHRGWTKKEAFVKAVGEGLSLPLKDFDVALPPSHQALNETRPDPALASRWTVRDLDPGSGYAAAIAFEGEAEIEQFDFG